MRAAVVLSALLISACDSSSPADPDATASDAAGEPADAMPGAIDSGPPPACLVIEGDPTSCHECLVGAARSAEASACTATVCEVDPSCCDQAWDARCVQLADARCEIERCLDTVAFHGGRAASVSVAQWSEDGLATEAWTNTGDRAIAAVDWADYDGDGFVDAVVVGECVVRVLRGTGWNVDQLALVSVFELDLGCTPGPSFDAFAVQWGDVDADGDLDAVVGGRRGAFWVRQTSGAFSRVDDLVPNDGSTQVTGLTLGDLDDDGRNDVAALALRMGADNEWVQTLDRFEHETDGFTPRSGWGDGLHADAVSFVRSCDIAGDHRRELMMGGWLGAYAHNVDAGALGSTVFETPGSVAAMTCADLDGDGKDEVVLSRRAYLDDGQLVIARLEIISGDQVVWRSTQQANPFTVVAGGIEVVDLDGDGDRDLVVGGESVDDTEGVVTVLRRQPGEAIEFTVEPLGDLLPGHDIRGAQVLHLPPRPAR